MRVENMTSSRGNSVPNQFIITNDDGVRFQSYDSMIVFKPYNGKTQLGRDWEYSNTTGTYRNQFLGETKRETLKKLESGEYILNLEL